MTNSFALAELVEMGMDVVRRDSEVLMEKADKVGFALALDGLGIVLKREELDAVAGGEDEALADAGLVNEGASGIGKTSDGDGEPFANLDRRGVVVDAK
jgi:hypothetical protein